MTKTILNEIFEEGEIKYGLSLFTDEELTHIISQMKKIDGKISIKCQIKNKYKLAKPEEIVRQLWIYKLIHQYNYPKKRIVVEKNIYFGSRESGEADIAILHENRDDVYIIFELKRPKRIDGINQLKSYCNAEGSPIGIWSNGNDIIKLHREEPNLFVEIPRIPKESETLKDIWKERWTIKYLEKYDKLKEGETTLKKILLDLEELVLGNAGVDPFEEIFKLIYAKLYDEQQGIRQPDKYQLEFFVGDRNPTQLKENINLLLDGAKKNLARNIQSY